MDDAKVPGTEAEQTLTEWIGEYSDAVLRVCTLYLSDRSLAEDALQDTWTKVWKSLSRGRKPDGNVKAWLMKIAVNTCKDLLRGAWFRHVDRRIAAEEMTESIFGAQQKDRTLSLIIMGLPEKYKQVILLYYYQGLTLQETGKALRLSASAVSKRLKKAEELLKEEWTGGEDV